MGFGAVVGQVILFSTFLLFIGFAAHEMNSRQELQLQVLQEEYTQRLELLGSDIQILSVETTNETDPCLTTIITQNTGRTKFETDSMQLFINGIRQPSRQNTIITSTQRINPLHFDPGEQLRTETYRYLSQDIHTFSIITSSGIRADFNYEVNVTCQQGEFECFFNSDCNDGNPYTHNYCLENQCFLYNLECISNFDCDDNDPYTLNYCQDNICYATPLECIANEDCDDNDPYTLNYCQDNICYATPLECIANEDCDDNDPYTLNYCQDNICYATPLECIVNEDCDDGDPNTQNICNAENICEIQHTLTYSALEIAELAEDSLVIINETGRVSIWPKDANDYANSLSLTWAEANDYCNNLVFCYDDITTGTWSGDKDTPGTCANDNYIDSWILADFDTTNENNPEGYWTDVLNTITLDGSSYLIASPAITDTRLVNYFGDYWTENLVPTNPTRAWRTRLSQNRIFNSGLSSTFGAICIYKEPDSSECGENEFLYQEECTICSSSGAFFDGSGTSEDPYLICNWEQLHNARTDLNAHYKLINDLGPETLDYSTYNTGSGWEPIGSNTDPFYGTFNGQGNTIENLYINRPSQTHVGLFGYLDSEPATSSRIFDLYLKNVSITGNEYTGGITGYAVGVWNANSIIERIKVTGTITGEGNTGGITGYSGSQSLLTNIYSKVHINGEWASGGISGANWGGIITNSYTYVTHSAGGGKGGITGGGTSGVTDSYWNTDLHATSSTGEGRTTSELQDIATFTGWNIAIIGDYTDEIWKIDDGNESPRLWFE
ncbi:MAG: hypothetical protein ACMXYK_02410 [Candidatus Woesearchaeota archaeon]